MNPPNRVAVALPAWAKAAMRTLAREDERSVTRWAAVALVDAIREKLGPVRVAEFQKKYMTPCSTEASE